MKGSPRTRRQVMAGVLSLGMTALAGCQTARAASLEPAVPSAMLEASGWEHLDDIDEELTERIEVAGRTQEVHVESNADVYGNDRVVRRTADRFDVDSEAIDVPGEAFIAAKARVDPPLTRLLGISDAFLSQAMNAVERQAKGRLRQQGFRNIERVEERSIEVETGQTATHRTYRAEYPYESVDVGYRGQPVTIRSGTFTIEAQVAVWPYEGLLVAGEGLYPGEPGELQVEVDGHTRQFDLALQPSTYRDDIRGLIRSIS